MAALYLHNAIFVPEPSEDSSHHLHNRTASSGTLRTTTSDSHPTEPLLRNTASESSMTYYELLSHQPSHPDMPQSARENTLDLFGDPVTTEERKGFMEMAVRRRLRRLRLVKRLVELIVAIWTIYNLIRYFIAYSVYTSFRGQVSALSLGAVTSASLAIFLSSEALSLLKSYLMFHDVPLQFQFVMRTSLHALSHFLLLVPAIVNFALVIAWRNLKQPDIAYLERCALDIDVIWSVSKSKCNPWTWQTWVSFALVRIFLTLALIVLHFYTSLSYQKTRRPGHVPRPLLLHHARGQSASQLLDSQPTLGTPTRHNTHQASYATLASSSRHRASSSSLRRPSSELSSTELDHTDPGLDSFYDRYSAAINQIHRETEEGMIHAQPDIPMGGLPPGAAPPRPSENYLATMAMYDEYGRPRPPEGHVRVLGTYVKRMPTIESIGSREAASIISAQDRRGSLSPRNSISRPPTRANTFSTISMSEPPSRSNSLTVAAERLASGSPAGSGNGGGVLAGVSEVGEVLGPRMGSAGTGGTFGTGVDTQPSLGTSYYTAGSTTNSARTTPE